MMTAFFLITTAIGTLAALVGFFGITLGVLFPLLAAAAALPLWMVARAEKVMVRDDDTRPEEGDIFYRRKLDELWENRHDRDVVA